MSDDPMLVPPQAPGSPRKRRQFVCIFLSPEGLPAGGSAGLTLDADGVSFSFDLRHVSHVRRAGLIIGRSPNYTLRRVPLLDGGYLPPRLDVRLQEPVTSALAGLDGLTGSLLLELVTDVGKMRALLHEVAG
jgi:hypothetical protein